MILPALLLLLLLSAGAAEQSGACGAETAWTLDADGTLRITGTGEIADGAFGKDFPEAGKIRAVVIGEGVTRIGESAFAGCEALESVTLPESLTAFGDFAFEGCGKLTEMTLPDGMTELSGSAFSDATARLVLSGMGTRTAETLGEWCYPFYVPGDDTAYIVAYDEENNRLGLAVFKPADPDAESVSFPEGMECVNPGFFSSMTHVKEARIPDSMTELSIRSFEGIYRDFVILCGKDSAAERFAREQGLQFDNGEERVAGWEITDSEEKVRWIVKNYVRPDMTEREKALVLHNWIINNAHYDGAVSIYESDRILLDGIGVCEAYSQAYYRLLKEAGLAVCTVSGDALQETSAGHAWNMARIDGTWYHVDCTWDDPGRFVAGSPCVSGMEKAKYFLMTDAEMGEDHTWDPHYSADRGRMFSWYNPAAGKDVKQQSWDYECRYLLDWEQMTAAVLDVIYEEEQTVLRIPDEFYDDLYVFQVTGIEEGACRGNTLLKTVTVGENVEFIGADAFRDCPALRKVNIRTEKLTAERVGEGVFGGLPGDAVITCPESRKEAYRTILTEKGVPAEQISE